MKKSLEEEKKKVHVKKTRLEMREKLLREQERKLRTKHLIEVGALATKAGIGELDKETLFGAFLELKERAGKQTMVEKWKGEGRDLFEKEKEQKGEQLIVSFEVEASQEVKERLKGMKFRWNPFRREWYGYGHKKEVEEALESFGAMVESVDG
ncbi:MAG: conjugal transfer protein TraD [Simkania negevensis]|nr:conjugal transfer protein TraD [Simkania negevensis]